MRTVKMSQLLKTRNNNKNSTTNAIAITTINI